MTLYQGLTVSLHLPGEFPTPSLPGRERTSNGHVSEEEPAGDEGLLGGARPLAHDVQVRGVKAQGGGGQAIRHQVDPQQLDRDQSLGEPQRRRQEDTGQRDGVSGLLQHNASWHFLL